MKKYVFISCLIVLCFLGCSSSKTNLHKGVNAYNNEDYERAYNYFVTLAQGDNPDAEMYLGKMYLAGNYVDADQDEARHWFEKAAAHNPKLKSVQDAQAYLGLLYLYESGVPQDPQKALYYLQKSANEGSPLGESLLGMYYISGGMGAVPENNQLGIAWCEKAAASGDIKSKGTLGMVYLYGLYGVKKDYEKAYNLLLPGVQEKNPVDLFFMSKLYLNGLYVKKDESKAIQMLQEANDLSDGKYIFALNSLGDIYFSHLQDIYFNQPDSASSQLYTRAFNYYMAAARLGDRRG